MARALQGVVMTGLPGNAATNAGGVYTATVDYGWSGTVTPTLIGYAFAPASRAYTNVLSNQTQDHVASRQTCTISGTIRVDGAALQGVVMTGLPGNAATNAGGVYTATVDYGWSGTVTPTLAGYAFLPASKTYSNVISNQTQDHTATRQTYTISGDGSVQRFGDYRAWQ